MSSQVYFVFDVESVGLHGEAFAWGYVVIDSEGNEIEQDYAASYGESEWPTPASKSEVEDYEWVKQNVLPSLTGSTHTSLYQMRETFWEVWSKWRKLGAIMVADCPWPVESNFLSKCIRNDYSRRKWEGPYPLIDVSTALLMAGMNPLGKYERLENELPEHNPTKDARQSARLFLQALTYVQKLESMTPPES